MYQVALLLLTGPLRVVADSIGRYLGSAAEHVSKRLYIKLEPELLEPFTKSDSVTLTQLSTVVPIVYRKASTVCKPLDVRVLLTSFKQSKFDTYKPASFDVIITNCDNNQSVMNYVSSNFDAKNCDIIKLNNEDVKNIDKDSEVDIFETYRTVCLGGTFDRLHNGHKVMLSEALLKTTDKLIVGVSVVTAAQRKALWELVEPVEKRIDEVQSFLTEVDPSLTYDIMPIYDPFGPTITNPDMDCLVVTTETKIGGDKVNALRSQKGMHELPLHVIDLVENAERSKDEDEKLSSSTIRMQLLGKPLKNKAVFSPGTMFRALLQGHLASDKSEVANRIQAAGVPVLCCDEVLRAILTKDESFIEKFSQSFPEESLNGESSLNFQKLKILCLKNKDIKSWLIEFASTKVKNSLEQVLNVYESQGTNAVVITDSTFFEGVLQLNIHETWAVILPPPECLNNLKEQFNLSEEEATEVFETLPANINYVRIANILFSNKWSAEATQEQVKRAVSYMKTLREDE